MTHAFDRLNVPLRVLHVDDDEDDYIFIRDILLDIADLTFEIEWESSYEAALEKLLRNEYDLCLLDYFMNDLVYNGLRLFHEARDGGSVIPCVMLTGTGNRQLDLDAMASGVSYYVDKNRLDVYDLERAIRYSLEHARMLRLLEDSNERLDVIFKTASDAIVLTNARGEIEITNPAFDHLFGYSPGEMAQQPLTMLAIEDDREIVSNAIQTIASEGTPQRNLMVAHHKKGGTIDIEFSLAQVVDNDGHLVGSFHDVSHFKTIERLKDDFVSMVTHELRTPISATLLSMEILLKHYDHLGYEKSREKLVQSHQQIMQLTEIVDSILDISAAEATRSRRDTTPVVLQDSLHRALSELMPRAIGKKLDITVQQSEDLIVIEGKDLDFTRIWRNLISNAVKYTPDNGQIWIRLYVINDSNSLAESTLADQAQIARKLSAGSYVVGQVEDTGHGMPEEDLEGIFDRFYRGWAKNSNIAGTGLGLALVRDLLETYDGQIHASSTLSQGSVFTFWIPSDPKSSEALP